MGDLMETGRQGMDGYSDLGRAAAWCAYVLQHLPQLGADVTGIRAGGVTSSAGFQLAFGQRVGRARRSEGQGMAGMVGSGLGGDALWRGTGAVAGKAMPQSALPGAGSCGIIGPWPRPRTRPKPRDHMAEAASGPFRRAPVARLRRPRGHRRVIPASWACQNTQVVRTLVIRDRPNVLC